MRSAAYRDPRGDRTAGLTLQALASPMKQWLRIEDPNLEDISGTCSTWRRSRSNGWLPNGAKRVTNR